MNKITNKKKLTDHQLRYLRRLRRGERDFPASAKMRDALHSLGLLTLEPGGPSTLRDVLTPAGEAAADAGMPARVPS